MSKNLIALVAGLVLSIAPAAAQDRAQDKAQANLDESQALGAAIATNLANYGTAVVVAARTQDPEVRAYALRVAEDYQKANRDLLSIVEKNNLMAADSPVRDKIVSGAQKDMNQMWSKAPGADLDKEFLTSMIEDQRTGLNTYDQAVIPAARSKDLKDALNEERSFTNEHFEQACTIGNRLGANTEGCPTPRGTE